VLFRLVFPPAAVVAFAASPPAVARATTVRASYSNPADAAVRRVTILPDGQTLDVDDVF
jgi:hypothetical protein